MYPAPDFDLLGDHLEPELFLQRPRERATDRVGLPVGRGHDFLDGRAVRRAEHGDQRGLLGTFARRARLGAASGAVGASGADPSVGASVAPVGAVCASSGSMPMAARPASVATSVTPWPSPVSRQRGSPLRMSASTSCEQALGEHRADHLGGGPTA